MDSNADGVGGLPAGDREFAVVDRAAEALQIDAVATGRAHGHLIHVHPADPRTLEPIEAREPTVERQAAH